MNGADEHKEQDVDSMLQFQHSFAFNFSNDPGKPIIRDVSALLHELESLLIVWFHKCHHVPSLLATHSDGGVESRRDGSEPGGITLYFVCSLSNTVDVVAGSVDIFRLVIDLRADKGLQCISQ